MAEHSAYILTRSLNVDGRGAGLWPLIRWAVHRALQPI